MQTDRDLHRRFGQNTNPNPNQNMNPSQNTNPNRSPYGWQNQKQIQQQNSHWQTEYQDFQKRVQNAEHAKYTDWKSDQYQQDLDYNFLPDDGDQVFTDYGPQNASASDQNRSNNNLIKKNRVLPIIILVISLIFSSGILFWTLQINQQAKQGISGSQGSQKSEQSRLSQNSSQSAQNQVSKNPESISFRMRYFGNAFWGRYMNDWAQASDQKFAYPFESLETIARSEGESWIAGLECPITPAKLTSAEQESILQFNCLPEYLPEASKHFQVFNLANNHTDNMEIYQGKNYDGFGQTRENLEKYNIQYFGHYDNAKKDDICEIISLKAVRGKLENNFEDELEEGTDQDVSSVPNPNSAKNSVSSLSSKSGSNLSSRSISSANSVSNSNSNSTSKSSNNSKQSANNNSKSSNSQAASSDNEDYFPVALCGYHNVFKLPTQDQIDEIQEYAKYFITITSNHQGREYSTVADSLQTDISQRMIKAGSDAIISDHVHVIQNTEVYQGKLIVYSMGNFMFDQQPRNFPRLGAKIAQSLSVSMDFDLNWDKNLESYLKLGSECQKFRDNCLKKAKEQNLKKPKYNIKYSAIGTDNSTRQPKRADKDAEIQILEQANWLKTIKELEKNS